MVKYSNYTLKQNGEVELPEKLLKQAPIVSLISKTNVGVGKRVSPPIVFYTYILFHVKTHITYWLVANYEHTSHLQRSDMILRYLDPCASYVSTGDNGSFKMFALHFLRQKEGFIDVKRIASIDRKEAYQQLLSNRTTLPIVEELKFRVRCN